MCDGMMEEQLFGGSDSCAVKAAGGGHRQLFMRKLEARQFCSGHWPPPTTLCGVRHRQQPATAAPHPAPVRGAIMGPADCFVRRPWEKRIGYV